MVPLLLPVVQPEPCAVLERVHVEVCSRDGVPDREARGRAQRVGVGRQLRALEEDRLNARVRSDEVHGQLHDAWLHDVQGNLLALGHCVETLDVLAALDDEAILLYVEAAAIEEHFLLWLQRLVVGRQDENLVLRVEGRGNHGALNHRRHEDGLRGYLPGKDLEAHHEAAVARDGADVPHLEVLDGLGKVPLRHLVEVAVLGHLEGQPGTDPVEDVIPVARWTVDVAFGRWVVVVQAHDPQDRRPGLLRVSLCLLHNILGLRMGLGFCLSLRGVVDKLFLVHLDQVGTKLVGLLMTVPLGLPVLDPEARVVLAAADVEVGAGDGVPDGQPCGRPQGVRVGRQLRALEQDGLDLWGAFQVLHGQLDDAWLD
mmetsp:Transcript_41328/g.117962  ORF Transcript_41328/g.117962 Transcript_41328/m.117962 type:complete len:370 (+) Transcript_41328:875-1984(+)